MGREVMDSREQMIVKHMPLVAFVVGRMSSDGNAAVGVDKDDAIGYGLEGLIQAVDAYDPSRGTTFASFAIRRIRGAVLDAVRKHDPLPRSLRKNAREIERVSQELAVQLGRWPTQKEIALRMGIGLVRLQQLQSRANSRLVSLEYSLEDKAAHNGYGWDLADEDVLSDPAEAAEKRAAIAFLTEAVSTLTERDKVIIRLRYGESRPFHEIGRILGLSESRVCQLHKRIICLLRKELRPQLEEAA
jgi:RNA polymerase sigma factor for flagellar operon FliA